MAQRWGKGQMTIDLHLEQGYPGAHLNSLDPSPDGRQFIAMISVEVSSQPLLVDIKSGKVETILDPFIIFYDWKPDGQKILISRYGAEWYAGEYDLLSGEYQLIDFPPDHDDRPVIDDLAYSPDGKYLADALTYQPNALGRTEFLISIGVWDTLTWERETIQEISIKNAYSSGINRGSLTWSADGHFLAWVIYSADTSQRLLETQNELWISDRTTGENKRVAVFDNHILGSPAVWSPDGSRLAVVIQDQEDAIYSVGNIFLIDPKSGEKTQVSHFQDMYLSRLQWSANGQWIFCQVWDQVSRAIWAVNVKSGVAIPVAGPTLGNTAFFILQ